MNCKVRKPQGSLNLCVYANSDSAVSVWKAIASLLTGYAF